MVLGIWQYPFAMFLPDIELCTDFVYCRSPLELTRMISDLQKNQLSMVEKQGSLQARYYYYTICLSFPSLCGKIGLTYEIVSSRNDD